MPNATLMIREYGEGRILISSDDISGAPSGVTYNSQSFWRSLIGWTGKRYLSERIDVGLFDFRNDNAINVVNTLGQIKVDNLELHDILFESIFGYNLLIFVGTPEDVDSDTSAILEQYVENGGGILISVPSYDGEIAILSDIESILVDSIQPIPNSIGYWTVTGENSTLYNNSIALPIGFQIDVTNLSSNWSILMTDQLSQESVIFTNSDFSAKGQMGAEFGISYTSSLVDGLLDIVATNVVSSTSFSRIGNKVNSSKEVQTLYGVYLSSIISASSLFVRWNELTWAGETDDDTDVIFYAKSADTTSEIEAATWVGPFYNSTSDLSELTGKYLQVMVVLKNSGVDNGLPRVDSLELTFINSENAVRFFTKAFEVGFTPKHAVLTYNADEPDDAVIKFAISGEDTADVSKYQYIEPNKIVSLDYLAYLSTNVKIMVEIKSSSEATTTVDEFAVIFGGDDVTRINKECLVSSSGSSESSSSTSESSSSSSLDSSSSSSKGYSSDSSSSSFGYSSDSSSSSVDSSSSGSTSSESAEYGIWPPIPEESSSSSSSSSSIDSSSSSSDSSD
tara:strand:- start:10620 stop:12314 length:1695 start_codon:yes stop_codon:yes gene_type:complete